MIALDTNIVLRYLVKDDAVQTQWATQFLRQRQCLLLPTVILESAWVMGSKRGYALEPTSVAERLRHVAGLPTVVVEQALQVARAIDWYEAGMDFADALHFALSRDAGLATFDQDIKISRSVIGCSLRSLCFLMIHKTKMARVLK